MAVSKAGVDRTHQNAARQAGRGLKGDASGKSNKLPLENENAIQTPCSRSDRQVQFTITEKKIGKYSLNKIYAGRHHHLRRQDADYWHRLVQAELMGQRIPHDQFTGPVKIHFEWPGRLDLDNYAYIRKMVIDAIKGWLIVDDTKRYVAELSEKPTSGNAITVTVTEL